MPEENPYGFPGKDLKWGQAASGDLSGKYPSPTINKPVVFPAWTNYTPTISSGTGTLTTKSVIGRYLQLGKLVFVTVAGTITTNGTGATTIIITAPVASSNNTVKYMGSGKETNFITSRGLAVFLAPNSSNIIITNYDGTYPGVDGAVLSCSLTYESA